MGQLIDFFLKFHCKIIRTKRRACWKWCWGRKFITDLWWCIIHWTYFTFQQTNYFLQMLWIAFDVNEHFSLFLFQQSMRKRNFDLILNFYGGGKTMWKQKSAESCMIPDPHPIDYFVAPNAIHWCQALGILVAHAPSLQLDCSVWR